MRANSVEITIKELPDLDIEQGDNFAAESVS